MSKSQKSSIRITQDTKTELGTSTFAPVLNELQNSLSQISQALAQNYATSNALFRLDDSIQSMARAIAESANFKLSQPIIDLENSLKPFMESIVGLQNLSIPFAQLHDLFDNDFFTQLQEYNKREKEVFLESGWWLTPSILEIPSAWLTRAVRAYQRGNRSSITNLFRKVYQRDECQTLQLVVGGWEQNRYFQPWSTHIAQALEAHKRREYTLSVPTLLLVAEGIATSFCKKNKIYERRDRSRGGEKIKKAVKRQFSQSKHVLLSSIHLLEAAIDTTIYEDTDSIKRKLHRNILNRHAILHGQKRNYGTLKSSLQAFMLLDVLSELQ